MNELASPVESPGSTDDAFLLAWLHDRDIPCPLCRYNLRNLPASRCPECGRRLQLGLSVADPKLGPWVATLVGLLLPAAFGLLMIVGFVIVGVNHGWSDLSLPSPLVSLICGHLLASVPLSVVVIAIRPRFLRWSSTRQLLCAWASWAMLIVTIGATVHLV